MTTKQAVPEWAEAWLPGKCGCGSRLVRVECFCGGHTACASSGWGTEKCPDAPATNASSGQST